MEQGPKEQEIIRACFAMRMPLPDRIRNAPQLWFGLELYLDAFYELNTDRPSGWGVMPIPWSVIKDYALAHDFDDDQTERLFVHVRALDSVFREYHDKKRDG
jgi:hypothetical protein